MTTVLVRGGGIAASCCAHLLRQAGLPVAVQAANRPRLPAIMLTATTQYLLQDVFEASDLFKGLHRIRRRAVAWGEKTNPVVVPHSALVISEQMVLDRINLEAAPGDWEPADPAEWTIIAAREPTQFSEHNFGARTASATQVTIRDEAASDACWIESQPEGWLFLLPIGPLEGWLLSVGAPVESMLAASRFIGGNIAEIQQGSSRFSSHPRIAEPLAGPGWIACGTAALGFDPLCGDGAGHATREAILAAAMIRAANKGADTESLIEHYRMRLLAGFRRHLEVCRDFYQSGHSGPWWNQQVLDLNRGLEWSEQQLRQFPGFRYRLNGFSLEALS
ncbi:MAG: hypothetical protein JO323_24440 [Acidobacteriia bacterium]|nr:hypothetical protein [Terriglobia bacterium]